MFEEALSTAAPPGVDPVAGRPAPSRQAAPPQLVASDRPVGGLPADAERIPTGPELAAVLAAFDPDAADGFDLVEATAGWARLAAWVDANQARVLAALASRAEMRPDDSGSRSVNPVTNTAVEIAGRCQLTTRQAENQVGHSLQLVEDFPDTRHALAAGLIDLRRARVITDELGGQDPEVRARVEAAVLPKAPTLDAVALRKLIKRLLHELAPVEMAERHRLARDGRYVAVSPASDGMAFLEALLPAEDATALNTALKAAAADAKRADTALGVPARTSDQRRADALAELGWAALTACAESAGTHAAHAGATVGGAADGSAVSGRACTGQTAHGSAVSGRATDGSAGTGPPGTGGGTDQAAHGSAVSGRATDGSAGTGPAGTGGGTDQAAHESAVSGRATDGSVGTGPAGTGSGTHQAAHASATRRRAAAAAPSGDPGRARAGSTRPGGDEPTSATAGTRPRRRPVSVQVTVPFSTLVGLTDEPGELEGYGPIPAHIARQLAADDVWTWLRTDPATGQLLDLGRSRYRPTTTLADLIVARDRTCRAPGCHQPARGNDIDHIVPFAAGGTTSRANCHTLCTTHHLLKHRSRWTVHRQPDGATHWTSPTGHQYRRPAEPIGRRHPSPGAGRRAERQGAGSQRVDVVREASTSGKGSTPRPGPDGTATWPSSSTNGDVTSWAK